MTALQKTSAAVVVALLLGLASYEAYRASTLQSELHALQGRHTALASQPDQPDDKRETDEHRAERIEPQRNTPTAVSPELLRLRGEVGQLRQQLAAAEAKAQGPTNHISFSRPVLPRAEWTDQGTDKPLNAILTMFWALRQGDQSKLQQIVWPMRDSQTLEDVTFRRGEWDKITAIQVAKVLVISRAGTEVDGNVEVIVEKAPPEPGADKDVEINRWFLMKTNGQWFIRSTY